MKQDSQTVPRIARFAVTCALLVLPLWFASCSSSKIPGVPDKLPDIALSGSSATPPHHMAGYEYPFDTGGNYVGEWAAEGERRAGRSALATSDDENRWSGSHGGRASATQKKSPVTKVKSGTAKSKSSDDDSPPKKKPTGSSSSAAPKSSGQKYVVKKGDTVAGIASKLGVSVKALKSLNGLESNAVRAGRVLKVPR